MSLAKVVVSGTVESDAEKRFTPNNHAVTNFNITVKNPAFGSKQNNDEPFSVKVTCWRALADAVVDQVKKGDDVLVEGRLLINTFQTPEGAQKKSFEIEANTIDKLGTPPQTIVAEFGSGQSAGGNQTVAVTGKTTRQQEQPVGVAAGPQQAESLNAEDLLTDDDIPF